MRDHRTTSGRASGLKKLGVGGDSSTVAKSSAAITYTPYVLLGRLTTCISSSSTAGFSRLIVPVVITNSSSSIDWWCQEGYRRTARDPVKW